MQIEVNLSEADIGRIKVGQDVIYTVIVDVGNDDLMLKSGMTANVSIIIEKKENIL